MTDYSVTRDRWGRPLLFPRDDQSLDQYYLNITDKALTRVPYTRASTLAKALDDTSNLTDWKSAMVALGMVREQSLYARVGSILSKDGSQAWAKNKKALKEIVNKAASAAGTDRSADSGTALHDLTEVIDSGRWPEFMPPNMYQPMVSYQQKMQANNIKVLDNEPFLVVDSIRTAGSMDKLVEIEGCVYAADVKSGINNSKFPLGVTAQTAIYAHGERYNTATDERTVLHPEISMYRAVLIEIPRDPDTSGKHDVGFYWLDIEHGWDAVQTAMKVREVRKVKKLERFA